MSRYSEHQRGEIEAAIQRPIEEVEDVARHQVSDGRRHPSHEDVTATGDEEPLEETDLRAQRISEEPDKVLVTTAVWNLGGAN
ncbi:hypothetical protein SMD44_p20075 (plasmid) [Streptomyces alboflavus]|uniref:Uncharacterized protein n=1 Tax=Streptomyces alboflavus TaxID=67267 RepID=A0A291W4B2_9ACTN|nr:hypothetical protein [Streptomyces alboflavus]ATM24858.1 hypothetical protein SMD44_p20075 [Streptomyces alboflavus]